MATININAKCDLNKPVVVRHLDGMVFSQDVKANMIRVSVFRDREPVDLSGGSVSANIIRADGATVVQTGTIEGNVCSVVLPSSAYAVPGQIAIFVKHSTSAGPTTSTIAAITGYVYKSTTDTIVDPGSVVPNVNQLLAMIEDCEEATEACIAATAAAPVIDDTAGAGDTNRVWSASKASGEISTLNTQISNRPESMVSDADTDVFDVVDNDGYVIARFKDGHVETKEFDSRDAVNAGQTVFTDGVPSDLDVIDSNGNVIIRFRNGNFKTKNFDSSLIDLPVEYLFSNGDLLLAYGYTDEKDAVVVMNEGRSNVLFDFSDLKLKPKGKPLSDCEQQDFTAVWHSGTDMHGPFEFLAVNNPDGYHYDSTDPSWTGGVHTANIDGDAVKTAETEYIYFFADGHPVSEGYGKCTKFEIRWANDVQAWNCVKADGTGRTSLIEYHDMIFDGVKFTEQVRITPTEDIKMQLWYGFQGVAFDSVYTNIAFVDGENRLMEDTSSARNSGNNVTSGIIGIGSNHAVEITVDTNVDLGKRQYYTGTEGAFSVVSTGKVYFCLIKKFGSSQVEMPADTNYYLRGSYRFYPNVQ